MELVKMTTATFTYIDGFYVDVVINGNRVDYWLWHKDYGIKQFIFGIENNKNLSVNQLIELVNDNLECGDYIEAYEQEYMDEEV